MKSRLITDPEIRGLLLILLVCVIVLVFALTDNSQAPCLKGERSILLCDYYNASIDGKTEFHKGCTTICNMSDVEAQSYLSGSTSRTI
jgi:hypothetical protein